MVITIFLILNNYFYYIQFIFNFFWWCFLTIENVQCIFAVFSSEKRLKLFILLKYLTFIKVRWWHILIKFGLIYKNNNLLPLELTFKVQYLLQSLCLFGLWQSLPRFFYRIKNPDIFDPTFSSHICRLKVTTNPQMPHFSTTTETNLKYVTRNVNITPNV